MAKKYVVAIVYDINLVDFKFRHRGNRKLKFGKQNMCNYFYIILYIIS